MGQTGGTRQGGSIGTGAAALALALLHGSAAAQTAPRYEHRVVVATTALDRETDVDASLERNVNRFGRVRNEVVVDR